MTVGTIVIESIKDFVEELTGTIEWILAGCPKPVPIPIKDDKYEKERRK